MSLVFFAPTTPGVGCTSGMGLGYCTATDVDRLEEGQAADPATGSAAGVVAAVAFMKAAGRADASALATFAPKVTDWALCRDFSIVGKEATRPDRPMRHPLVAEVMTTALDYPRGPTMHEAMQLILNTAFGEDAAAAQAQARHLLGRMAATFAFYTE